MDTNGSTSGSKYEPLPMNAETRAMLREWLERHHGDSEGLAEWMRDALRLGSIRECRAMIASATKGFEHY